MAEEVTDSTFKQKVLEATKPVLVDFYATWCYPCQQQTPILEKWAAANAAKVDVFKLNVDEAPGIASQYGVLNIPTLIIFKAGKEAARGTGRHTEQQLTALLAKVGA